MEPLSVSTPVVHPRTGFLIKVECEHFEIRRNREMRQKVARVFYTNTGTSDKPEFGEPLLDVIERQWVAREITAEQYTEDKRMFATTYYSSDTENTMVDPRTGEEVQQVVVNEETGETAWPEGSIPELQFWINAMGPIADGVYSALLLSASKMVDRKRI